MNLTWNSFLGGATALPTGSQLASKSFLLEIYLWGGDGAATSTSTTSSSKATPPAFPPTLSIGDYVFADTNCNGIKNPREPGLPASPSNSGVRARQPS
jgi:hypothetical protein